MPTDGNTPSRAILLHLLFSCQYKHLIKHLLKHLMLFTYPHGPKRLENGASFHPGYFQIFERDDVSPEKQDKGKNENHGYYG